VTGILRWDMMRARRNGQIVYRHMPGLLRVVRGHLYLAAQDVPALGRPSFTATFQCDAQGPDDPLPLHDAHLVHADTTRLVLSGYECAKEMGRDTHYAQTWVLVACERDEAQASRGPPFPG
jgi:hypothetical protein